MNLITLKEVYVMCKSVYIHIPFCKNICSYCDFCKYFYKKEWINKYLDSLKNEIDNNYKKEKLKTIYIGGGTPSSLEKDELKKLFSITNKLTININFFLNFIKHPTNYSFLILQSHY